MTTAFALVAIGFATEALVAITLLGQAVTEEAPDRVLAGCLLVFGLAVLGLGAALAQASRPERGG